MYDKHSQSAILFEEENAERRPGSPSHGRYGLIKADLGSSTELHSPGFDLRAGIERGIERLRKLSNELKQVVDAPIREFDWARLGSMFTSVGLDSSISSFRDLSSQLGPLKPLSAILGISDEGQPVVLEFDDVDISHLLITGRRDAGKTSLLVTLATSISLLSRQSQAQFVIIDAEADEGPQGYTSLEPLSYLPHMLSPVLYGAEAAVETLSLLVEEMEYRQQQDVDEPTVFVLIDNVVEMLKQGGENASIPLSRIAQSGRQSGLRLVLTTQEPESETLHELLRANLPLRLVGMARDERSAAAAAGAPGTGADFLTMPGEFVAVIDGEVTAKFRSAFINSREMHFILSELQRCRPRPLLARPLSESASSEQRSA